MRRAHFATIVLLALTGMAIPAFAGSDTPFAPVPASELGLTKEPLAPEAPAIILFREVDCDDTHGSREYHHVRIKILTEEGRKYGNIEIPYWKDGGEEIKDLHARTIRPDGSIVEFTGGATDQTIAKAKKVKYLAKVFVMPEVGVGSIVEYSYEHIFNRGLVYDTRWELERDLFTKHAEFSLKPNRYLAMRCSWWMPHGVQGPKQGPDHVYRLKLDDIPAFHSEEFMPPETQMKARVEFIYNEFPFGLDSDTFWQKLGQAEYAGVEKFNNKRDVVQQALSQTVAPTDYPEAKLQKIYARVQQLHNTSYDGDKTTQEEKRDRRSEDKNVADVWKRGYGNEWQITVLFLALVRAAGFDASLVLAPSRRLYFFDPKQMDYGKIDSMLVVIRDNGKQRFFEPGALLAPFGLLPWPDTGITAFRVEKDGGAWIEIPMEPSSASRIERVARLKLLEDGDLEGKVTVTYTGHEAWTRRLEERKEDQAARKKYLEEELESFIPTGIEAEVTNQPAWEVATEPLVAEYRVKIPGWASQAGKRVLLPVGLFSSPEKHTFEHANRVHEVYTEFLSQRIDDVTIELPSGWVAGSLPDIKPAQGGQILQYSATVVDKKTSLQITRKLDVSFLMLSPQYYPGLQKFYQQVRTADEEQIVLQPVATTASN